jgi:hypothetical protein
MGISRKELRELQILFLEGQIRGLGLYLMRSALRGGRQTHDLEQNTV